MIEESKEEYEMTGERELACCIIDTFEDWLAEKGITKEMLPNKERDEYGSDDTALIFGSEYYSLEDEITRWITDLVKKKRGLKLV